MKLSELLTKVKHLAVRGNPDREVKGIAYDSRQVKPDVLFVAIPGTHCDGYEYAEEAVKRGSTVVVTSHAQLSSREVTQVQVEDTRLALAELSDVFYGHPSGALKVVGITGTNGKTTTAFMVRDVLESVGCIPGLIGTVHYEIGARIIPAQRTTPEALEVQDYLGQMVRAGCRSVVMEVSSHALDQQRIHGVDFDVALFTNLTRDHLDYHHTMECYFEAKRRLFIELGRGNKRAVAVINHDDPWGRKLAADPDIRAEIITFGIEPGASVQVMEMQMGSNGSECRVKTPWGESRVSTPLLGRFNLQNVLGAYTAGRALQFEDAVILPALAARARVPGRLEEIPVARGWRVFVDYAHTDDALTNVLETLRGFTEGRLIVVFGCGGNRDQSKRALMGAAASRLADIAIVTSDNPRDEDPKTIISQICAGFSGGASYEVVEDRAKAIAMALAVARDKDLVIIAGKGHETTQEIAGVKALFDDRLVVKNALIRMDG
ncbi:MAG: UDP-N-acetylmuramoyl-L-alanyl-D-glutamate--2,6-diaminopimelate ligase [bacterium]|jgi:UDP-N-acetylmuramoyl-L-alanyl-D-glutamate--2,6-diaminopimelate ligase